MRPPLLCYTGKGIPAAPAMARPEAHFRSRATLEKGKSFKSQTPQGDGNSTISRISSRLSSSFKSQTPQGDGNWTISLSIAQNSLTFQITNPARGRKRLEPALLVDGVEVKFQITNPARGRKRFARFTQNIFWQSFQITNPARGRKLNSGTVSRSMMICFKPQTPQGDGNGAFRRGIRDSHSSFKSQTPQGDGNTPASSSSICHHFPTFQITNPARGRRRGCTGSCSPFFL